MKHGFHTAGPDVCVILLHPLTARITAGSRTWSTGRSRIRSRDWLLAGGDGLLVVVLCFASFVQEPSSCDPGAEAGLLARYGWSLGFWGLTLGDGSGCRASGSCFACSGLRSAVWLKSSGLDIAPVHRRQPRHRLVRPRMARRSFRSLARFWGIRTVGRLTRWGSTSGPSGPECDHAQSGEV